jgi:hypothetical protein
VTTGSKVHPDGGMLILTLGAWSALAPAALGLADFGPAAVLPGATVALGGAILTRRAVVAGALLALAGGMWLVISQIGGLYGPDAALAVGPWLAAFLAPGALVVLAAVHALGGADPGEAPAQPGPHAPVRPTRTRDPHRRPQLRPRQGAHRVRHVRGDVRWFRT